MDVQLDQLRALRAAVDEGSFDAAARRLGVTPSAVSQRLKTLEGTVGRVLLHRGKPVQPTESGMTVLRLARQWELLSADTTRELATGGTGASVPVPFVVNADSIETLVLPALATIPPGLCFEIHREDQEHSTNLLRNGTVMAAVTSEAAPVQGCTVTRLGIMRYRPMASAGYARRWFPDGVTAAALSEAPVMMFDRRDDQQDHYLRTRFRRPITPPRNYVPSSMGFLDAVRLGLGWGMLPDIQSGPDEAAGLLVDIDHRGRSDVPLYWQQWKLHSPALTTIAEAITSAAAERLR